MAHKVYSYASSYLILILLSFILFISKVSNLHLACIIESLFEYSAIVFTYVFTPTYSVHYRDNKPYIFLCATFSYSVGFGAQF